MEDVEIERSDDNEPKRAKYAIQVGFGKIKYKFLNPYLYSLAHANRATHSPSRRRWKHSALGSTSFASQF